MAVHNVGCLCPRVATKHHRAKKSAAHRPEATEMSQVPEGGRGSVLPLPRLGKRHGKQPSLGKHSHRIMRAGCIIQIHLLLQS